MRSHQLFQANIHIAKNLLCYIKHRHIDDEIDDDDKIRNKPTKSMCEYCIDMLWCYGVDGIEIFAKNHTPKSGNMPLT